MTNELSDEVLSELASIDNELNQANKAPYQHTEAYKREYQKGYYQANKERIRAARVESNRKWRQRRREAGIPLKNRNDYQREWYQANKERIRDNRLKNDAAKVKPE